MNEKVYIFNVKGERRNEWVNMKNEIVWMVNDEDKVEWKGIKD